MHINYKQRQEELNDIKSMAKSVLKENLEHNKIAVGWQKRVVDKNIFQLKNIIQDINIDLRKENVKKYVDAFQYNDEIDLVLKKTLSPSTNHFHNFREIMSQVSSFRTIPNIAFHSKFATIDTDINWAIHPTVIELTDISLNNKSPTILERYVPNAIESLRKSLNNYSSNNIDLDTVTDVIYNAIQLSEQKQYSGSNIILITCLEAISLKLIEFAYSHQNPDFAQDQLEHEVYKKYGSLYKLITQIELKADIPITYLEAAILYKHSTDPKIIKMTEQFYQVLRVEKEARNTIEKIYLQLKSVDNEKTNDSENQAINNKVIDVLTKIQGKMEACEIKNIQDKSLVGLNVKLEFLTKKIYEERNLILHGQFQKVDNNWKNYMYLVAVIRLLEICKDYENVTM